MPKFEIQQGVTYTHNGKKAVAGDIIELSMAQAASKIARGEIKLTAEPLETPAEVVVEAPAPAPAKHHARKHKG
jgi:hypothetical protein